ncbi:DUF5131 family protein [Actinomadura sp. 6N118]|uniref:DUF5131 family protein n=1 Tax=Actinomadura sp. 6N118 TaxID=3375151 RepID=UPI0037A40335
MSAISTIEWTQATWNPTLGCDRVSPGCDGCYAITQARIRAANPHPKVAAAFAGLTHRTGGRVDWTGRVNQLPGRLTEPLRWRKPRKVFVDSLSDLFHAEISEEFIARVFAVMAATPHHTYQVLTKRHGRMRSLLARGGLGTEGFPDMVEEAMAEFTHASLDHWPLPNVWLGVSAEDQQRADLRVPDLLGTPAAVRFVSAEPLLGPVDLSRWLGIEYMDALEGYGEELGAALTGRIGPAGGLHWVIVGGESGPRARPMHPDWARTLRDQCAASDVPFFFKQWGEWGPAPWSVRILEPAGGWEVADSAWLAAQKAKAEQRGATHDLRPSGHLYEPDHKPWSPERDPGGHYPGAVRRWGKKRAGRELDGRSWDQYPDASADPSEVSDVPTCRGCGCTDDAACPGGCHWVPDPQMGDLCSRCTPPADAVIDARMPTLTRDDVRRTR